MIKQAQLDEITRRLGMLPTADSSAAYIVEMWRLALQHASLRDEAVSQSIACDAIPYVPAELSVLDAELTRESRVLDLGCCGAYGSFDLTLRREKKGLAIPFIDCVDVDERSVAIGNSLAEIWAEKGRVNVMMADANRLPMGNAGYDLVIARLLLPYVGITTVLDEIGRVLKPDGVVLFQTHAHPYYIHRLLASWRHPKRACYYIRPIVSGLWFSWTGIQPRSSWFSECFLSLANLEEKCCTRSLGCIWRGGQSWKPMAAFRKNGR